MLNIMIVVTRYRKNRSNRALQTTSNQAKVTTVVFGVVGMYLVLSLPSIFVQTLIFTDDTYSLHSPYKITFYTFMRLGDFLNSMQLSTFPYTYFISSHYRSILKIMFGLDKRVPSVKKNRQLCHWRFLSFL